MVKTVWDGDQESLNAWLAELGQTRGLPLHADFRICADLLTPRELRKAISWLDDRLPNLLSANAEIAKKVIANCEAGIQACCVYLPVVAKNEAS